MDLWASWAGPLQVRPQALGEPLLAQPSAVRPGRRAGGWMGRIWDTTETWDSGGRQASSCKE